MNTNRVVLKYKERYYHNYMRDSWDVDAVAPGTHSSGYFKYKGGTYLSIYSQSGAYIGRVHANRIKALRVNNVALWEVFNPDPKVSEGLSLIMSAPSQAKNPKNIIERKH